MSFNIAHRGAARFERENTLAAFQRAAALGADGIELDVRLSSDGEVMVVHDSYLLHTTNGKEFREIHRVSCEQLQAFGIPTLDAVLKWMPAGFKTFVELKYHFSYGDSLSKKTVEVLLRYPEKLKGIFVISFNATYLRQLKDFFPQASVGLTFDTRFKFPGFDFLERAKKAKASLLIFHISQVRAALIESCKTQNFKTAVWGIEKDVEEALSARRLGIDYLITDIPDLIETQIKKVAS